MKTVYLCNSKHYENLGNSIKFIWKYCVKISGTFHVPVKYENSNTTAKAYVFTQHTSKHAMQAS